MLWAILDAISGNSHTESRVGPRPNAAPTPQAGRGRKVPSTPARKAGSNGRRTARWSLRPRKAPPDRSDNPGSRSPFDPADEGLVRVFFKAQATEHCIHPLHRFSQPPARRREHRDVVHEAVAMSFLPESPALIAQFDGHYLSTPRGALQADVQGIGSAGFQTETLPRRGSADHMVVRPGARHCRQPLPPAIAASHCRGPGWGRMVGLWRKSGRALET